mgnify:CR=1 FL=1
MAQGVPGAFCVDFEYELITELEEHVLLALEKDFDKKYPRNLLEYFPLISSKDSIMELEGIDPRSSKRIFH